MDKLVDIFYYDYILCRIIDMYSKHTSSRELGLYCKLANTLHMEYADTEVELDSEIYAKTVLIKLLQLSSNPENDQRRQMNTIMLYLRFVIDNNNFPMTPLLRRLITTTSICYAFCFAGDESFNADNARFIIAHNGAFDYRAMLEHEKLGPEFDWGAIFEHCKSFEFGRPVIFEFVSQIKTEIDNGVAPQG